jgi:uncharacterized Zn-binding protein involved in type VI secretion
MKKGIARIGDLIDHGGSIISGSSGMLADGLPVARVGDSVMCAAHGVQTIISGSSSVYDDNKAVAIEGSNISCGAKVISASETVFAS